MRAWTPLPNSVTATGVRRCVVEPSPSWPLLLLPQQRTAPAVVRAQVWGPPAVRAWTPLLNPVTATSVSCGVVEPSPSWP